MYYGAIKENDIANGPGVRVSLFVSGCRNRCKGCFQPETWNFKYGNHFTGKEIYRIYDLLYLDHITGLSILGGDPFEPENIEVLTSLCRLVKTDFPKKTIWIYTGYLYEDFKDHSIMEYIDVLVDGPFIEDLKDISLQFRGSSNQRIIDVKETRKRGEIVLWDSLKS